MYGLIAVFIGSAVMMTAVLVGSLAVRDLKNSSMGELVTTVIGFAVGVTCLVYGLAKIFVNQ